MNMYELNNSQYIIIIFFFAENHLEHWLNKILRFERVQYILNV